MDTDIHAAFMSVIGRFSRSMNNAYLTADKGGLEQALQRHDEQALKRLLKQALLETELDELLHYARQQFPVSVRFQDQSFTWLMSVTFSS